MERSLTWVHSRAEHLYFGKRTKIALVSFSGSHSYSGKVLALLFLSRTHLVFSFHLKLAQHVCLHFVRREHTETGVVSVDSICKWRTNEFLSTSSIEIMYSISTYKLWRYAENVRRLCSLHRSNYFLHPSLTLGASCSTFSSGEVVFVFTWRSLPPPSYTCQKISFSLRLRRVILCRWSYI